MKKETRPVTLTRRLAYTYTPLLQKLERAVSWREIPGRQLIFLAGWARACGFNTLKLPARLAVDQEEEEECDANGIRKGISFLSGQKCHAAPASRRSGDVWAFFF